MNHDPTIFDIEKIISRFKIVAGCETDVAASEIIGVSKSNFANQKKKGTIYRKIVEWAAENDISVDWIMTGGGSPYDERQHEDKAVSEPSHPYYETETDILVRQTREILDSNTDYAQSLAANIKSFYSAIQSQKDLNALKHDNAELKKDVAELKEQNRGLVSSIKRLEGRVRPAGQKDDPGTVQGGK